MLVTLVWLLVEERHWPLPPLFVVWANAHGGVSAGGLLLAAVTVVAVVRARGGDAADVRRAVRLCVVAPLCALATTLTPLGFRVWHFVGGSLALSRQNGITEWQLTLPTGPFEIIFWILAAAFVGLVIWRRGRLREASWSWGDTVILTSALVTLPLGFVMVRNTAMFLLVAIPAASRLLGPGFRFRRSPAAAASDEEHPRANLALFVGITLVELAGVLFVWSAPPPRSGWQPMSPGAIEAVRSRPERIYNRFYDGGFLIWFVPDRPVFIDNRQDPYPSDFIRETTAVDNGAPYRAMFDRYGIRCAFVPADSKMIERLETDHWTSRFRDDTWAVLTAPGAD